MQHYNDIINQITMAMGAAWGSGINLYATILVLGISAANGSVTLPPGLEVLANPLVIGSAALMYCVEFFADKVPGVDTGWDAIHTFVRIPAGALLAAGAMVDMGSAAEFSAALLGGAMAASTHSLKAGSRVLINTSPEPFTNWGASIGEDIAVITGVWAALNHPILFAVFLVVFILFLVWFLPKIWRGIKKVFSFLGRKLGFVKKESGEESVKREEKEDRSLDKYDKLEKLNSLFQKGAITKEEYEREKSSILQPE